MIGGRPTATAGRRDTMPRLMPADERRAQPPSASGAARPSATPAARHLARRRAVRALAALATLLASACAPAIALASPAPRRAARGRVRPARPGRTPRSPRRSRGVRVIAYRGMILRVPSSWPVFNLSADPATCVRFNRHAVYVGAPGAAERCPASTAGRTEAILISPLTAAGVLPAAPTGPGGPHELRLVQRGRGVAVLATWGSDPQSIRRALGLRSLAGPERAAQARPAPQVSYARARALALSRSRERTDASGGGSTTPPPSGPASAGAVYTGLGFDACSTPSASSMAAWAASPYRAIGVYIGGANMACAQGNLNATWVAQESAAGWHLVPIYVGLQAPSNSCGCAPMSAVPATAASEGTAAAEDAVVDAQAIGIGAGNPLYLDMESYSRTTTNTAAVLAFEAAWTQALHAQGYLSGVYSSSNSGITDLVSQYGTSYVEPDDIWVASWNGQQSTVDPNVPPTDWANHQRLHQYTGSPNETYGGVRINIDDDFLDAATAAAGTGPGIAPTPAPSPSLAVKARGDGTVSLSPSWPYEQGIAAWQALGGESPTALTFTAAPTPVGAGLPIVLADALPYWSVQALDASGQVLGTSAAVAEPAALSIFGASAFVPQQGFAGLPVSCFQISPCTLRATIRAGRSTIEQTRPERLTAGHGLLFFAVPAATRRLLSSSASRQLPVSVTVADQAGHTVTRTVRLTYFATSDPAPPRREVSASALQFVGLTEFVSHGWVGGVLAACVASTPCDTVTTLVAGRRTIARTSPQQLGAGELGYLFFKLTPYGHELLMHSPGNQLGTYATLSAPGAQARAHVALVAFR